MTIEVRTGIPIAVSLNLLGNLHSFPDDGTRLSKHNLTLLLDFSL